MKSFIELFFPVVSFECEHFSAFCRQTVYCFVGSPVFHSVTTIFPGVHTEDITVDITLS